LRERDEITDAAYPSAIPLALHCCPLRFDSGECGPGGFWWRGASRVSALEQGIASYNTRDWQTAEKRARETAEEQRDDTEALRLLARSLFREGRDQQPWRFTRVSADNMMAAEDYFLRGQAFVHMGQKERGILLWRQALGLDLNHIETLAALEQVFFRLDLLNEAARAATASVSPARLGGSGLIDARQDPRRAV